MSNAASLAQNTDGDSLVHRHFLILGQTELDLHVLQYVIRYSTLIFSFDDALGWLEANTKELPR